MTIVLWVLTGIFMVPAVVLAVECFAALVRDERAGRHPAERPGSFSVAVLVPAHDEEPAISRTLTEVTPQLSPRDRLIVVADNCTDRTAELARSSGAEVVVRNDPGRRGKGYALAAGIDYLRTSLSDVERPDVVVMIDADTRLTAGSLGALAHTVIRTGRPAQAIYRLAAPSSAGTRSLVSALAFATKNHARVLGTARLRWPCLLTGSGMAVPWGVVADLEARGDNIVEDLQLGIDLAIGGNAAVLCDQAHVRGELPACDVAIVTQRRRWEHGHLKTIITQVPRLLAESIRQHRLGLFAMALDVAVPPLCLLVLLQVAVLLLALGWLLAGGSLWLPLSAGIGPALVGVSALLAWWGFCRDVIPLRSLMAVPGYIASKIPLYLGFLTSPERSWVRTPRDAENS